MNVADVDDSTLAFLRFERASERDANAYRSIDEPFEVSL